MKAETWNIIGLVLAFGGVVVLFVFGMPFHVPTGGAQHLILEEPDEGDIKKERLYKFLGAVGLLMILAGTGCQIVANIPSILAR